MSDNYSFLILHYLSLEDTVRCVFSIQSFCKEYEYHIVIVDNGSNNGTGAALKEQYSGNEHVTVLLSEHNLGFANGNNLGFKYIKDNLNPDFIIMINNDTYMIQSNFCSIISDEYQASGFGILGPRILMNGNRVSDYPFEPDSLERVTRKLKALKRRTLFNRLHLSHAYNQLGEAKKTLKGPAVADTSQRKEGVVLQGCALVFSKKYIDLFDGIDNRTYLYNEEQLLYWRAVDNDLLTVYNPYLMIYHNENAATNKRSRTYNAKERFVIENEIKSTTVLYNDLRKRAESQDLS